MSCAPSSAHLSWDMGGILCLENIVLWTGRAVRSEQGHVQTKTSSFE